MMPCTFVAIDMAERASERELSNQGKGKHERICFVLRLLRDGITSIAYAPFIFSVLRVPSLHSLSVCERFPIGTVFLSFLSSLVHTHT